MAFDINAYLAEKQALVNKALDLVLPGEKTRPAEIHGAMRYALFAGGKRLRPILALAAAQAVGADPAGVLRESCALEILHTYTLIHDDLPAMDDDDYRRGRLTTHKVYGEAIAVLAGDALLTEAFKVLADSMTEGRHEPRTLLSVIQLLADAGGSRGVIGGQVVDMLSEGKQIDKDVLEYIHTHKTGLLITASVLLGAVLAQATEEQNNRLCDYSRAIGLAFQITDDILDVQGSAEELGKPVGSDQERGKATYPAIFGMNEAKRMQGVLFEQAIEALRDFDENAEPLRAIAKLIIERNK
ncbi:MAG: polyprenyl synthetase family protein [Deltaproteobacteria bacterium]|nr:polyprenyl synthetase family protein [Deltaproteobacteria bacterium]